MQLDADIEGHDKRRSPFFYWWLFAPFAALLLLAGYLGLQMGQPVSDTEIITHFAAHYVTQTGNGAAVSDCFATPSQQEDIRLIVTCTHPDGTVHEYPSGPQGEFRTMPLPEDGA